MLARYTQDMHERDEPVDHSLDLGEAPGERSHGWGIKVSSDGKIIQGPDPGAHREQDPSAHNRPPLGVPDH